MSAGKGDSPRPIKKSDWDKSSLWCPHGRMKDKCPLCKQKGDKK